MAGISDMSDGDKQIEYEETPPKKTPFILAVDVGTTSMRSYIYDKEANIKGQSLKKVHLMYPQPGHVEMDPKVLWRDFTEVVKEAIRDAGISSSQVTCMGLTSQRNTFITWDRETGIPFHNLITWQDLRASEYVQSWNNSITMKGFHGGSKFLHFFTRQRRFFSASILKFTIQQVTMRLLWMIDHDVNLRRRSEEGQVMFGTMDTWLLWRLTGGETYVTDASFASGTGMYDPFIMEWSSIICNLVGLPMSILPPVKDTSGFFCKICPEIFGASIPITAVVGDQQAAMFGQCCFEVGDVKCTMGSGTFLDLNTGDKPHTSIAGLYPLVGWKIGKEVVYLAEGSANDTATVIDWAKKMGLYDNVNETSDIAESVEDSGGVYFVAAFDGLQAPINDETACTSIFGINPKTRKPHILRAILESVAFRFKLLYEAALMETNLKLSYIRADGGVCNNDFILQLIADLISQPVDRPENVDMSSLGAAFLAGLATNVWKDKEDLKKVRKSGKCFQPRENWKKYRPTIQQWERAIKRSMHWYKFADPIEKENRLKRPLETMNRPTMTGFGD